MSVTGIKDFDLFSLKQEAKTKNILKKKYIKNAPGQSTSIKP